MSNNRDEDSGRFTEQYAKEKFLRAVKDINNATTSEVANSVGCSYDLAYRRLNELSENNEVTIIQVGSSFIWTPCC
jgi:hypothetical protein